MERMGMPDDEPIEHPWVTKIHQRRAGEGRGQQLRHPEEPPRVRRRDERAAEDGLQDPPAAPPRHLHARARRRDGQADRQGPRDQDAPAHRGRGAARHQDMVLHYGTPCGVEAGKQTPEKIEEVTELFSMESLRADIYQFWGYRFDFKESDAKKPQAHLRAPARRDPAEPVGAARAAPRPRRRHHRRDGRGVLPGRTSRPRTGTGRASRSGSSSTSASKPQDFEHINDHEQLAHILYTQAAEPSR